MLYFRSCPRCRLGTVELTVDFDGPSLTCLNCAYTIVGTDNTYSRDPRERVQPGPVTAQVGVWRERQAKNPNRPPRPSNAGPRPRGLFPYCDILSSA